VRSTRCARRSASTASTRRSTHVDHPAGVKIVTLDQWRNRWCSARLRDSTGNSVRKNFDDDPGAAAADRIGISKPYVWIK